MPPFFLPPSQVMVTNVTSLLKTVKAVEDEATRGTRALEATIEYIKQELTVVPPPGPVPMQRCKREVDGGGEGSAFQLSIGFSPSLQGWGAKQLGHDPAIPVASCSRPWGGASELLPL